MNEIAPWENPDLPAPIATTERFIKDRVRRFALWFWDGRLVWRDLNHPRYWWATLDCAEGDAVKIWETAVEMEQFGSATTANYEFSGDGTWFGLPAEVAFEMHAPREFFLIRNGRDGGLWRAKYDAEWQIFHADEKACAQSQSANLAKGNPSIWHTARVFPSAKNALAKTFLPTLANVLSPNMRRYLEAGKNAPPLIIARDLLTLVAARNLRANKLKLLKCFNAQLRLYNLESRLCRHFNLPKGTQLTVSYPQNLSCAIRFGSIIEDVHWSIGVQTSLAPTAHETLEAQLRLRDALRPLLTPTEIEEILAPSARL